MRKRQRSIQEKNIQGRGMTGKRKGGEKERDGVNVWTRMVE